MNFHRPTGLQMDFKVRHQFWVFPVFPVMKFLKLSERARFHTSLGAAAAAVSTAVGVYKNSENQKWQKWQKINTNHIFTIIWLSLLQVCDKD